MGEARRFALLGVVLVCAGLLLAVAVDALAPGRPDASEPAPSESTSIGLGR